MKKKPPLWITGPFLGYKIKSVKMSPFWSRSDMIFITTIWLPYNKKAPSSEDAS